MTLSPKRPQRRISDHYHPDLWSEMDHHRFEDRLRQELKDLREQVSSLSNRMMLLMGAVALMVFLIPIVAPFIRGALFGNQAGVP